MQCRDLVLFGNVYKKLRDRQEIKSKTIRQNLLEGSENVESAKYIIIFTFQKIYKCLPKPDKVFFWLMHYLRFLKQYLCLSTSLCWDARQHNLVREQYIKP